MPIVVRWGLRVVLPHTTLFRNDVGEGGQWRAVARNGAIVPQARVCTESVTQRKAGAARPYSVARCHAHETRAHTVTSRQ